MRLTRTLLALALNFSIAVPAILLSQSQPVLAQDANAALQRGYRTGYSDGYMAGYRDSIDSLEKSISRHREYESADRAYNKDYGSLDDYRDGYRQGFQTGYDTGFDKKTFESSVPANIVRVGATPVTAVSQPIISETTKVSTATSTESDPPQTTGNANDNVSSTNVDSSTNISQPVIQKASYRTDSGTLLIPKDTEIVIQLQEDISTEANRQGERFTAKVISQMELDGAIVEGHVEKVQLPGRIKGAAQLQLTFDRIVFPDGRWANFNAILIDITAIKGDNVRRVNDEGTAVGQSSIKGEAIKIGGATGAGAGVGAIVGGPVGAAVGAGIGVALGIGAAVSDRGKHIRLNKNQQLRVRSSYETQIR